MNLTQLVKSATRGKNVLDLVFTTTPLYFRNITVLDPLHGLDHFPLLANLKLTSRNLGCSPMTKYKRHAFHYNNGDFVKLQSLILEAPWHTLLLGDVNDQQYTFTKLVKEMINECVPNYDVVINSKDKPGMTNKIKRLFNKSNKLHKKALKSKLPKDIDKHKTARRIAKAEWKKARFQYYHKLNLKLISHETSTKAWWKLNKQELGLNKKQSIPSLICDNKIVNDTIDKCEALNNFFANQCNLEVPNSAFDFLANLRSSNTVTCDVTLDEIVTSEKEINSILKTLNVNKACGSDLISNVILKNCSEAIAFPLSVLFNSSLHSSIFPDEWKKADVCSIFKKNDPQICSNYRPISLLSSTSKVLERIVFNQIYEHCKNNKLLTPKNSGFKKLDSTVNQLIHITNQIYKGLDDSKKIAAVFLDVSKAFDRVWHIGLLHKIEKLGIRGKLLRWIESYLSGRYQRVILNGSCSSFLAITSGVPQGSILGPLLFLIFINDLVDNIESDIFLFADDTSLLSIDESWEVCENKLNRDLDRLDNWSKDWLIHFNASKTEYLLISNKPKINQNVHLNLILGSSNINQVSTHKHLGVVLNETLTWTNHVDNVCNRVSKRLGLLYKVKKTLTRNTLVKLYNGWIKPVIEYCSPCMDNLSVNDNERLERQQFYAQVLWLELKLVPY